MSRREDLIDEHVRARRRMRAIEVGAFPVRRDVPGGVTDPEWTVVNLRLRVRAIADNVWLLASPIEPAVWAIPDRLAPARTQRGTIMDWEEVIGVCTAFTDGQVTVDAGDTRTGVTLRWPLKAAESGVGPG